MLIELQDLFPFIIFDYLNITESLWILAINKYYQGIVNPKFQKFYKLKKDKYKKNILKLAAKQNNSCFKNFFNIFSILKKKNPRNIWEVLVQTNGINFPIKTYQKKFQCYKNIFSIKNKNKSDHFLPYGQCMLFGDESIISYTYNCKLFIDDEFVEYNPQQTKNILYDSFENMLFYLRRTTRDVSILKTYLDSPYIQTFRACYSSSTANIKFINKNLASYCDDQVVRVIDIETGYNRENYNLFGDKKIVPHHLGGFVYCGDIYMIDHRINKLNKLIDLNNKPIMINNSRQYIDNYLSFICDKTINVYSLSANKILDIGEDCNITPVDTTICGNIIVYFEGPDNFNYYDNHVELKMHDLMSGRNITLNTFNYGNNKIIGFDGRRLLVSTNDQTNKLFFTNYTFY